MAATGLSTAASAADGAKRLGPPLRPTALWSQNVTVLRVTALVVVFLVWEILARSGLLYKDVVPPLDRIAAALVRLLLDPALYGHALVTGTEVLVGFVIGTVLGVAVGVPLGAIRFFSRAVEPLMEALATAPKSIFLPVAMLALGVGMGSKVAIGALSCVFVVILSTAAGVREIRPILIRVGHSFHLGRWQMFGKIYLPAILPALITGMRLGLGVTIIGVLLAEIKLANTGLGFMAIEFYNQFRTPEMYALLTLIFACSVVLNAALGALERRA